MDYVAILIIGVLTFGICFVADKGFTKIFRGEKQHKTGLSVRLSQHYGGAGIVLGLLGIAAIFRGATESMVLLVGGCVVLLLGIALLVYYMSFGIYYDGDSFVLSTFGKKSATYSFADIQGQKLYQVTGGSVLIELHLRDGRTVGLQSTMKGVYPFLDAAFEGWCRQNGTDGESCDFHDPSQSHWFPEVE